MLSKQLLAAAALAGLALAPAAFGDPPAASGGANGGFYGGVSLRSAGTESDGIDFGHVTSTWGRFVSPIADDNARRALVFGGYRFGNDVAVEGAFSSAESFALRPFDSGVRRGVGLSLVDAAPDLATHSWNADVYTTWSFRKTFALYGRLGYTQNEGVPTYVLAVLPGDPRRLRDGVNYGVGLRYDVTPALGLRLEYARFPRFAGESIAGPLPDSDQVQFGMQLRF